MYETLRSINTIYQSHSAYAPSGSLIQAEGPRSSIHSVHGAGIVDTVKSVADFVSQNKDTFKDVSKAVSSVSSASSNIAQAIKAAKRFNELREASKLSPTVISELQIECNKKGDRFEIF